MSARPQNILNLWKLFTPLKTSFDANHGQLESKRDLFNENLQQFTMQLMSQCENVYVTSFNAVPEAILGEKSPFKYKRGTK